MLTLLGYGLAGYVIGSLGVSRILRTAAGALEAGGKLAAGTIGVAANTVDRAAEKAQSVARPRKRFLALIQASTAEEAIQRVQAIVGDDYIVSLSDETLYVAGEKDNVDYFTVQVESRDVRSMIAAMAAIKNQVEAIAYPRID